MSKDELEGLEQKKTQLTTKLAEMGSKIIVVEKLKKLLSIVVKINSERTQLAEDKKEYDQDPDGFRETNLNEEINDLFFEQCEEGYQKELKKAKEEIRELSCKLGIVKSASLEEIIEKMREVPKEKSNTKIELLKCVNKIEDEKFRAKKFGEYKAAIEQIGSKNAKENVTTPQSPVDKLEIEKKAWEATIDELAGRLDSAVNAAGDSSEQNKLFGTLIYLIAKAGERIKIINEELQELDDPSADESFTMRQ